MSLESWKSFFEIGGVTLLFLTFIFGTGALFTSTRINKRQAEQIRLFEKELAKAQKEAAEAQLALKQYVEARTSPRSARLSKDRQRIVDALKGKATSRFEILYVRDDEDGYDLGRLLADILKEAGWTFVELRPLKDSDAVDGMHVSGAPPAISAGVEATWGLRNEYNMVFVAKTLPPMFGPELGSIPAFRKRTDSAILALLLAVGSGNTVTDAKLPDDFIRIVIGQKQ
jgi:hypothetical protein